MVLNIIKFKIKSFRKFSNFEKFLLKNENLIFISFFFEKFVQNNLQLQRKYNYLFKIKIEKFFNVFEIKNTKNNLNDFLQLLNLLYFSLEFKNFLKNLFYLKFFNYGISKEWLSKFIIFLNFINLNFFGHIFLVFSIFLKRLIFIFFEYIKSTCQKST
jgi:hypothetical protein